MQPGSVSIAGFNLYLKIKDNLNFNPELAKFANTKSIWFLKAENILTTLDFYKALHSYTNSCFFPCFFITKQ